MIPERAPLRVVGDVHGDARAFAFAAETDRFVVQLGDLADGGPEGAEAWRIMLGLLDAGRGLFVLGNHDRKLARTLSGGAVSAGPELRETMRQLGEAGLGERVLGAIRAAPAWIRAGDRLFVHGGFHPAMLHEAPPPGLRDLAEACTQPEPDRRPSLAAVVAALDQRPA